MNNIFENAYFGKQYKTRDGRKALLLQVNNCAVLAVQFDSEAITNDYKLCGKHLHGCDNLDIISEWKEEIDEEKLERLRNEWWQTAKYQSNLGYVDCFNAGYRKALSIIGINYENDSQQSL